MRVLVRQVGWPLGLGKDGGTACYNKPYSVLDSW